MDPVLIYESEMRFFTGDSFYKEREYYTFKISFRNFNRGAKVWRVHTVLKAPLSWVVLKNSVRFFENDNFYSSVCESVFLGNFIHQFVVTLNPL